MGSQGIPTSTATVALVGFLGSEGIPISRATVALLIGFFGSREIPTSRATSSENEGIWEPQEFLLVGLL